MDEQEINKKLFEYTEKIAELGSEVKQLNKSISVTNQNIGETLKEVQTTITAMSKSLDKVVMIQGMQSQDFESLKSDSSERYTKMKKRYENLEEDLDALGARIAVFEARVNSLENRVKNIESDMQLTQETENKIRVEKTKGKWALFAAVGTALVTAISSLILALLNK